MKKIHELPPDNILQAFSEYYELPKEVITGKSRKKENDEVTCRHLLVFFLRKYNYMNYEKIAEFVNMSHSNAIYAYNKMKNMVSLYDDIKMAHDALLAKLKYT